MPKKKLTEDIAIRILKDFTLECVHGGDFDQGQSEKVTLSIMKNWWNTNKEKYTSSSIKESEKKNIIKSYDDTSED